MKRVKGKQECERKLTSQPEAQPANLELTSGSRVAIIGGGPAGSFFSYFLLDMAQRVDINIQVDMYEPKSFLRPGPDSCNMCGGIVSESLVQILAAEGINLPSSIVQRGIDSYVMHMDVGHVHIKTPLYEKRIASVHRGGGPQGIQVEGWPSFDGYLQKLAITKGANMVRERVVDVSWEGDRPQIKTYDGSPQTYDLLGVAVGVNSSTLKLFNTSELDYQPPQSTKAHIAEFPLGQENVQKYFGSSMHVFLLDMPRLKFAALIPKEDYVTLCLLGQEIDNPLVQSFLAHPEVRQCFPPDWNAPEKLCRCYPRIPIKGAPVPFADRVVFIGDCGVSKLYKDGIGAAYSAAKAAATTAIFKGISAKDFQQGYLPACRNISTDNNIGKAIFASTILIKKIRYAQRGILRMVSKEQQKAGGHRRMSMVLWDVFTGSAPYRNILLHSLHPFFLSRLVWNLIVGLRFLTKVERFTKDAGGTHALGRVYQGAEIILHQGNAGDCMYVIQAGQVEVFYEKEGREVRLAVLGERDFFGEVPFFERKRRSSTVRAMDEVRVLTVDKRTLLRRIHEDPSLAYRILQTMSRRLRQMEAEVIRLKAEN